MGMFDYVIGTSVKCPKCSREHTEFQSKDLDCFLDRVDYRKVSKFYTNCDCGFWIEYHRRDAKDLSDFEMVEIA